MVGISKIPELIINADDLGINEFVNQEIARFADIGAISSSSILANGHAFSEVEQIVKKNPQISYGVHLNLDEFKSLTNSTVLMEHRIVDENGSFIKGAIFNTNSIKKDLRRAIEIELCTQIERIRDAGIHISHVDGHHFLHTNNDLFEIMFNVCQVYKIRNIRLTPMPSLKIILSQFKEISTNGIHTTKASTSLEKKAGRLAAGVDRSIDLLSRKLWIKKAKKRFATTDGFFSYKVFFENVNLIRISNKYKRFELMCHPGHSIFDIESELVERQALRSKINYRMISYNEI